eukprot:3666274-Amphidinium_carterae.1
MSCMVFKLFQWEIPRQVQGSSELTCAWYSEPVPAKATGKGSSISHAVERTRPPHLKRANIVDTRMVPGVIRTYDARLVVETSC